MKRNRLIATVLAVVMILGLVSVGFAAGVDLPDLEDYEWETEVRRLASLGVFEGYPDGEFKPENTVTRAEFSKMIVCILGLENAANLMKGETVSFSDVDATHWASGYINVAEMKGIVNGYPDGTFKPEGTITHAEALKMILTAMGYLEEGFLVVRWPATWVVQATEIGLDDGVEVLANVPITRGAVAKLLDNGLTEPHVKVTEKGFVPVEVTFMDKLDVDYEVGMVVDSPELWSNTSKKVEIKWTEDNEDVFKEFSIEDYEGLLGHNVRVWYKGKTVLAVEDLSTEKELTYKEWKDIRTKPSVRFENYLRNDKAEIGSGHEITVVYDGSKAIAVKALTYEVGQIDVIYGYRNAIYVGGDRLNLDEDDYYVEYIGVDGFDDLEEGDTVQYIYHSNRAVIIVVRDVYEGKLTEVAHDGKIKVDGEIYAVPEGYLKEAENYLGGIVRLYFDRDGKVYKLKGLDKADEVGLFYGVVQGTSRRFVKGKLAYFANILTLNGEVEYEYEPKKVGETTITYLEKGNIVKVPADSEDDVLVYNDIYVAATSVKGTVTSATSIDKDSAIGTVKVETEYNYTKDTLWIEGDVGSYETRPRPFAGDTVELYVSEGTIVVGIVGDPEEPGEKEPPVEPKEVIYNGVWELDGNYYITLGDETYPYVGSVGDLTGDAPAIAEGAKVTPTFITVRGETVVKEIKLAD